MGWKNLKEHFDIKHHVQVRDGAILIGSNYISDIMVIGFDGVIRKPYNDRGNENLVRYQTELSADPNLVRDLIATPDTFTSSITVYTYKGAEIITKQCETLGWPNLTHDGEMMYNNTFSPHLPEVVKWAKRDAHYGIQNIEQSLEELRSNVTRAEARLHQRKLDLSKLDADYPAIIVNATDL